MTRTRTFTALAALTLALALGACKDDGHPSACSGNTPTPPLVSAWPHEDGRTWSYDFISLSRVDTNATLVGPGETILPPMSWLHDRLEEPFVAGDGDTLRGRYGLTFDGEMTTDSGVTTQYLHEEMLVEERPGPADDVDPLLVLLARTRPDLRDRLPAAALAAAKSTADGFARISGPLLLHGYAFAWEDSGYYGYGDISTHHSWVFMERDLEVGTEFSLQLVPELADDIFLYGRVWSRGPVSGLGETRCDAVEVMYVIDLGEQFAVDENAALEGVFRGYVYGVNVFVPGVGPVYSQERNHALFQTAYNPTGTEVFEAVFELTYRGSD
ncbi:hypothetical protein KDM41_05055 [bacterium]|nr:hypothetical protein [bacterium]